MNTELTNAEKLVMKCIWDTPNDMVLSEIFALVNERYCKDWSPQTVSTYLARLVQKGFLAMTRNGKIYTYHWLVNEKDYVQKIFQEFKAFWGISSIAEFLSAYFERNEPSQTELQKIKELYRI